jgi:RNA polymerase sigma factor (sigma-70 family)
LNISDYLILMVEDEPDQVLLTKRALSRANLVNPLRVLPDGEQAIAYLSGSGAYSDRRANPLPSLVLLDLRLPRIGGLQVLEWIRSQPPLKTLPVVILTASINPADRQRAAELGVTAYICKPVVHEGLLEMMKSVGMYWMILNRTVEESAVSAPSAGAQVLILDSDPDSLAALIAGLRSRSPSMLVEGSADAADALSKLSEGQHTAMVVDAESAGEPVADFLSKVRDARPGMPVFVLAADASIKGAIVRLPRLKPFIDIVHQALAAVQTSTPEEEPAPPPPAEEPPPRRFGRQDTEILGNRVRFQQTSWELVRSARETSGMDALIREYWKPLYFFVRQRGYDNETAKDLVQEFLTEVLQRDTVSKADPERGRFRTFLLTALTNYIKDWHKASSRQKRGGGRVALSLDVESGGRAAPVEVASSETPEKVLNRAWAQGTLERCLSELTGKPEHLQAFEMIRRGASYAEIARETGMSLSAAKTAILRLRQQLRDRLLERLQQSGAPVDADAAMADFATLFR